MTGPLPHHRGAQIVLLLYVLLAAAVLLQPSPTVASNVVIWCDDAARALGAPAVLTAPGRVEAVINAALFAPLATLALVAFPRLRASDVVTAGFVCSLSVEIVQGLFLPERSAQAIDVVANTSGAALGAVLVRIALGTRAQLRRGRHS